MLLFDTDDFPARWTCGNWSAMHGWVHIASDLLIWAAYLAIPCVLAYFVIRRRDVVFPKIFWLFGAFILSCGTVHLIEAGIFWWPVYRLSGLVKAITAVVSLATVLALIKILPVAINLPGLAKVNAELEREIERRKTAEAELKESRERYELAVRGTSDGLWDWDCASNEVWFSERFKELLGYNDGEVRNHFEEWESRLHPDDKNRTLGVLDRHLKDESKPYDVEYRLRCKDESYRWFRARGLAFRDGEEKPFRMAGSIQDVTERRESQRQMAHLSTIMASSTDAIMGLDKDRVTTAWNRGAESMLGIGAGEAVGAALESRVDLNEADRVVTVCESVRELRSARHFESRLIAADGRAIPASITVSPILDQEEELSGYSVICRDISGRLRAEEERKAMDQQIQQTQKLESLGVLAGGIAHDFNNLLAGILGNTSLAQMELPPVSPVREYLSEIEVAGQRAAELTRQMLAYSGKGRFVLEAINLSEVVSEMAHLLKVSISKKVSLQLRLGSNLPVVEADATQVRQIVMNLITNASEAVGDAEGIVTLTTGAAECDSEYLARTYMKQDLPPGMYVYLEVSDSGCGMSQETIARIFDPFYTTKFTGRGLGLAAVQGIVNGHHGAMRVYSEVGKGTTFKILFLATDLVLPSREGSSNVADAWKGEGRILLIDDEDMVLSVGGRMLTKMGFEVVTARDGMEGVERFKELHSDLRLVVLDLMMPKMNGDKVFAELKEIDPKVPVILSSGLQRARHGRAVRREGASRLHPETLSPL